MLRKTTTTCFLVLLCSCGNWDGEDGFTIHCGPRGTPAYATAEGLTARSYVEKVLVPAILEYRREQRRMPRKLEALAPRYVKVLSGPPRSRGRWRYGVQAEDGLAHAFHIAFRLEPDASRHPLDLEGPREEVFEMRLHRDGTHTRGRWR